MFLRKPRTIDAEEGDMVVIECEVAGDPKPDVTWLRDWLKVSTNIKTNILVRKVNPSDIKL